MDYFVCLGRVKSTFKPKTLSKHSSLSDASKNLCTPVFTSIYYSLLNKYRKFLSASSSSTLPVKYLKIVDSTTIILFKNILKQVGFNHINGEKKDCIKINKMSNALENLPCLVRFSCAANHDHTFLKELNLEKGSLIVFKKT